jgi:hypothetical protein
MRTKDGISLMNPERMTMGMLSEYIRVKEKSGYSADIKKQFIDAWLLSHYFGERPDLTAFLNGKYDAVLKELDPTMRRSSSTRSKGTSMPESRRTVRSERDLKEGSGGGGSSGGWDETKSER